ncbi:DUF4328 domain-containing protein [Antribacter sp. KLBMP9083]|uniref:DUF4328 domain-containing protein n=1 Tax=Antribacter soli TaxID=2910976 RepID=A0AA41QH23_9MICO|nr:DUF4328 domain-containing protein [Antribacter soli]MCF4122966.1 DUF4328 domain-containing protein [Antribacter soli]
MTDTPPPAPLPGANGSEGADPRAGHFAPPGGSSGAPGYGSPTPAAATPAPSYGVPAAVPVPAYGAPGPYAPAIGVLPTVPGVLPTVPGVLATAAAVLAWAYVGLRAITALSAWAGLGTWTEAAEQGLSYTEAGWVAYDGVALLLVPLVVASYVVGVLWLYRSRVFAETWAPAARQERGRVWVWLGWVVPVVSLWFPYQVVRDVRRATVNGLLREGLGLWWACWLLAVFLDRIGSRLLGGVLGTDPLDVGAVAAFPVVETIAAAVTAVGGYLWVAFIREITAAQRARVAAPAA